MESEVVNIRVSKAALQKISLEGSVRVLRRSFVGRL